MSLLELLLSSLRLGLRNKNIISAKGERGRESERERDTHTKKHSKNKGNKQLQTDSEKKYDQFQVNDTNTKKDHIKRETDVNDKMERRKMNIGPFQLNESLVGPGLNSYQKYLFCLAGHRGPVV